jgi:hypothetical protein
MIPKIIHYVWVGPKNLPDLDRQRVEDWRRLHPDWKIIAWGNDNIDYSSKYLRQAYSVRAWNRVSDYVRMDALVRHGGVYLDTDVDLLKPLDSLLNLKAFLGFQTDDVRFLQEAVNGAVFGAEPGHWLPSSIRDHFNQQLDGRTDIGSFSGPGLITQFLREKGLKQYCDEQIEIGNVTIFPKRFFYPYSWLEAYSDDVVAQDTYAVHRWAETWVVKRSSLHKRIHRHLIRRLSQYAPELAFKMSCNMVKRGSIISS